MKTKYKIRNEILKYLYNKIVYNEVDKPDLIPTKSSLKEISEAIKYPYSEVYKAHHGLPDEQARCSTDKNNHYMFLNKDGILAAIDEYWLREGEKEINERIYDKTKWMVPIIALAITLFSVIYSIVQISKMQGKLQFVEKELNELKVQKNTQNPSPIQHKFSLKDTVIYAPLPHHK